jgi:hypothetical protein
MKLIALLTFIGVISGVSIEEPEAMYQILKAVPNVAGESVQAAPVALTTKSQFSSLFGRARRLLQESATTTDESAASSNITYTYTIVGTVSAAQVACAYVHAAVEECQRIFLHTTYVCRQVCRKTSWRK